jgi:hypothetical protein
MIGLRNRPPLWRVSERVVALRAHPSVSYRSFDPDRPRAIRVNLPQQTSFSISFGRAHLQASSTDLRFEENRLAPVHSELWHFIPGKSELSLGVYQAVDRQSVKVTGSHRSLLIVQFRGQPRGLGRWSREDHRRYLSIFDSTYLNCSVRVKLELQVFKYEAAGANG